MASTYYFCVADFYISVCLPNTYNIEKLLPSFRPFAVSGCNGEKPLLKLSVVSSDHMPHADDGELIEESDNDMGHLILYRLADGYYIEIFDKGSRHSMYATSDFSLVAVCVQWENPNAGNALASLIRVAYAQAILSHAAVSIHASAVFCDGMAYLFMGKSGTGKSTHSSLWINNIAGTGLLNDDNPTIRIIDGKAYVYGTPWSGKTPCYKNQSFPIGGMARLRQAAQNIFHTQYGVDAFVTIYPGCSVIVSDYILRNMLYDTLAVLAEIVTVGIMECLPDRNAAFMCYESLVKNHKNR